MFMTKAIETSIPALYSQENMGDDAVVYVKYFNPCGSQSWFMTEYDPEQRLFFGYITGMHEDELGYFSRDELESIKLRFGLYIERDTHFANGKVTLGQIKNKEVS